MIFQDQRSFDQVAETKELREKVAEHKEVDAASENTPKGFEKKWATSVGGQVVVIEAIFSRLNASHNWTGDVVAQAKASAKDALAML